MPTLRSIAPGYVAGLLSIAAMIITAFLPAVSQQLTQMVTLVQLAVVLCGTVYYFMVIHRIHRVLSVATNGKYPVSGRRAVGFSFIPLYNLFWKFKWPGEIACFLNHLSGSERFNKNKWGWLLILSGLLSGVLPGLSLLLGFFALDLITKAILSVLPTAKHPIEDYTERYTSGWAMAVVFIFVAVIIFGMLAAIAIPNFIAARNTALERQGTSGEAQAPSASPSVP